MPGTPSYNKVQAESRRKQHLRDLETLKTLRTQEEAAKREQEAYILAEGGTEDGLKSILNRNAQEK
jgi:hypothetical protein